MCGIVGACFSEKTNEELEFSKRIMFESRIRGKHSFGICFSNKGKIITLKSYNMEIDRFVHEFSEADGDWFIYHNRYSTSGDWKNMKNNMPLVINNQVIAMNGVLNMAKKHEFEKLYNIKCETENDAEIILQKINEGIDIVEFIKTNQSFSFAGVLFENGSIYGLRNNKRPLYLYETQNAKFLVSTLDILCRAGGDIKKASLVMPLERCYLK